MEGKAAFCDRKNVFWIMDFLWFTLELELKGAYGTSVFIRKQWGFMTNRTLCHEISCLFIVCGFLGGFFESIIWVCVGESFPNFDLARKIN